jgi:hypothetical protein
VSFRQLSDDPAIAVVNICNAIFAYVNVSFNLSPVHSHCSVYRWEIADIFLMLIFSVDAVRLLSAIRSYCNLFYVCPFDVLLKLPILALA